MASLVAFFELLDRYRWDRRDRVLLLSDASFDRDIVTFLVRRSTMDQRGVGQVVTLHKDLCSVKALMEWYGRMRQRTGPLFQHENGLPHTIPVLGSDSCGVEGSRSGCESL